MIRGGAPHAVLLVGPAGVGKTTLALDLAAGLSCTADDPAARPCGACRACRMVRAGDHADVHRLGPEGPGRQVVIGGPGSKARGVRDLVAELALMPVEGGARIAIIESAQRMNEDAQAALLKTLEEPPPGVTLVLCADAEEPLLPTIRSRCARLRLGPVASADIAAVLADHGIDDPALAARLARIAGGRPGLALAWAADPAALRVRDECTRVLLDLTSARPADRLAGVRAAAATAASLAELAEPSPPVAPAPMTGGRGRRKAGAGAASPATAPAAPSTAAPEATPDAPAVAPDAPVGDAIDGDQDAESATAARTPAAQRRRAAEALVSIWTDVARDLVLARHESAGALRDPRLLEESMAVAGELDDASLTAFLDRLGRAGVLLSGNVGPELVLDDLALAWPQRRSAVA
jgi:DNA polymerase III delta' subunit